VWLTAVASLCLVAVPDAATRTVVVRAYNTYGLAPEDVRTASRTVHRLLWFVDIDVRWRNCRIAGRPSDFVTDACADPMAANHLIVRLLGGVTPPPGSDTTLGYAHVDPVLKTGSLATIDVERIVDLSHALAVDCGTLLGRAVAHELGHLLRGTRDHSESGLMRGIWSASTIVENRPSDWTFTREQGLDMRSGLDARLLAGPCRGSKLETCSQSDPARRLERRNAQDR
jgi:hypothetical protein